MKNILKTIAFKSVKAVFRFFEIKDMTDLAMFCTVGTVMFVGICMGLKALIAWL